MKFAISCSLIIFIISCSTQYTISDATRVVKKECFMCHAPHARLDGMPLDSMYLTIGEEELRVFLKKEMASTKQKKHDRVHSQIDLSAKEIELVILYLKEYKDGVYH